MRPIVIRSEVRRLRDQRPYRPFVLLMESGDRVIVDHSENIAFDPTAQPPGRFVVISSRLNLHSTFDAMTGVTECHGGKSMTG